MFPRPNFSVKYVFIVLRENKPSNYISQHGYVSPEFSFHSFVPALYTGASFRGFGYNSFNKLNRKTMLTPRPGET